MKYTIARLGASLPANVHKSVHKCSTANTYVSTVMTPPTMPKRLETKSMMRSRRSSMYSITCRTHRMIQNAKDTTKTGQQTSTRYELYT